MSAAFTEKEKKIIKQKLLEAGNEYATTIGMKKTTVEELAQKAGISKGAFYKFYATKELLFFEVFEEWHTLIYHEIKKNMDETIGLPGRQRMRLAIQASIKALESSGIMYFYQEDMEYLLRKIPDDILKEHYHSDEVHLREMLLYSQIELRYSIEETMQCIVLLFNALWFKVDKKEPIDNTFWILLEALCEKVAK